MLDRIKIRGFTLMEVMVAVAVLAIISAIAYPNLIIYVKKSRMKAGMQFLQDVAVKQERFLLSNPNRSYATTPSQLGIAEVPANVQRDFQELQMVTVAFAASTEPSVGLSTKPEYVAVLTPRANSLLRNQFRIAINNQGLKWLEASTTCNTSDWAHRCCRDGACPTSTTAHPTSNNPANINTCANADWAWWESRPEFDRNRAQCPP